MSLHLFTDDSTVIENSYIPCIIFIYYYTTLSFQLFFSVISVCSDFIGKKKMLHLVYRQFTIRKVTTHLTSLQKPPFTTKSVLRK